MAYDVPRGFRVFRTDAGVRSLLCVAMLLAGTSSLARAAENPPEALPADESQQAREAARVHFTQGMAQASRGDYEGALREFTEAYALSPHFVVLYNIGQCQIELGRSMEAAKTLSKYLRDGQDQISPDRRQRVEAQIGDLLFAELTIKTDRAGVAISVDGREVGRAPLDRPIRLAAGTHTVSAAVAGAAPIVRTFSLLHGGRQVLFLDTSRSATGPAKITATQPPPWIAQLGTSSAEAAPAVGLAAGLAATAAGTHRDAETGWTPGIVEPSPAPGPPSRWLTPPRVATVAAGAGAVLCAAALAVYWGDRGRYRDWQDENAALKGDPGGIDHYARQVANNQLADSLRQENHLIAGLSLGGGALIAGGIALLIYDRSNHGREQARGTSSSNAFNLIFGRPGAAMNGVSWETEW